MKKCSRCKETKDFAEFNRNASRPDGYQYECRPCHNDRAREYSKIATEFLKSQRKSGETLRYTATRLTAESMSVTDYIDWLLKWTKHNPETDCYEWQGYLDRGYARFNVTLDTTPKTTTEVMAYRLSYALSHGIDALPLSEESQGNDSLVLDHICVNPSCVNPLHLQVVTQDQNKGFRKQERVGKKFSDLKVIAEWDEAGEFHSYA